MTDASLELIAAIVATFVLAGVVKGVTGIGFPTVAMGVLGAIVSPATAAALLIVPSFVTNVWQLFAGPSFAALARRLWPMMVGIVLGTIDAASLLTSEHAQLTTSALAIAPALFGMWIGQVLRKRISPATFRCNSTSWRKSSIDNICTPMPRLPTPRLRTK